MTTYTWPNTKAFCPANFTMQLMPNVSAIEGAFAADQTIEFPGAKWRALLTMPPSDYPGRASMEAWINRLRGPANRVELWHLIRPLPRGTLQGNTTANAAKDQYDQTISIAATSGLTLLAGDMIGIALENNTKQLAMVAVDTVSASGSMTVNLTSPLNWSMANDATITVIRPMARFRLAESPGFAYSPGIAGSVAIEFLEA